MYIYISECSLPTFHILLNNYLSRAWAPYEKGHFVWSFLFSWITLVFLFQQPLLLQYEFCVGAVELQLLVFVRRPVEGQGVGGNVNLALGHMRSWGSQPRPKSSLNMGGGSKQAIPSQNFWVRAKSGSYLNCHSEPDLSLDFGPPAEPSSNLKKFLSRAFKAQHKKLAPPAWSWAI